MSIEPDTKDWTWVLERRCPECGFDPAAQGFADLPALLRDTAAAWSLALTRGDAAERPEPAVWSALEYGCHVRDVYELFLYRLNLMLEQDAPEFANWDQDATAVAERYAEQDPARVAEELGTAAEWLSVSFAAVPGEAWDRPGRRSNGSVFTTWTLGVYALHDLEHHVWDVTRS